MAKRSGGFSKAGLNSQSAGKNPPPRMAPGEISGFMRKTGGPMKSGNSQGKGKR